MSNYMNVKMTGGLFMWVVFQSLSSIGHHYICIIPLLFYYMDIVKREEDISIYESKDRFCLVWILHVIHVKLRSMETRGSFMLTCCEMTLIKTEFSQMPKQTGWRNGPCLVRLIYMFSLVSVSLPLRSKLTAAC